MPALEQSLNAIIRRQETLRTTFPTIDGQPHLHIAAAQTLTIPVIDLRYHPRHYREAEALALAREEAKRPFNLTTGPLLRVTLYRLDDEDHLALLTMHHIISDGWSMGIFIRELAAGYTAVLHNRPLNLPQLPIQYADYAHWQRSRLQSERLETELAYWKEQLLGAPSRLDLPTDRPRPAVQTAGGAHIPFKSGTGSHRCLEITRPKRGYHPLHDPAGCLPALPFPLHRPGRHQRRFSHCQS
ncbi:MAG: condensation domain-containing protein [Anaerolineae bacterium]